jgi:hypothetical protein
MKDIDWKEQQDGYMQDAGLEPDVSPYFHPTNDDLLEAFGPAAWVDDMYGSHQIGCENDHFDRVINRIREYYAEGDALAIGQILIAYAGPYLDKQANYHGLEFDIDFISED